MLLDSTLLCTALHPSVLLRLICDFFCIAGHVPACLSVILGCTENVLLRLTANGKATSTEWRCVGQWEVKHTIQSEPWTLGYGRIDPSLQTQPVTPSVRGLDQRGELAKCMPAVCMCVYVSVSSLAGKMSLRACSILPRTSTVSMMPCLSRFKHTQTDQMKDKWAHRTSISAFLAGTDGLGATLIKHAHAHRAQQELGGRCRGLIESDTSYQDIVRPGKETTTWKRHKSLNQCFILSFITMAPQTEIYTAFHHLFHSELDFHLRFLGFIYFFPTKKSSTQHKKLYLKKKVK